MRISPTVGVEPALLTTSGGADLHTGTDGNQDSQAIEGTVQGAAMADGHSMGSATIIPGDQDPADDLARITRPLGTGIDTPRTTGDRILGNDQEAPTPTTTGEGITAGMTGTTDTPGAIRGKGTGLPTQDTGNRDTLTAAQEEDSDSSRLGTGGACPLRSTSSR